MIRKIKIPKISTNVEEVTLTAWLKKEGEPVRKGEPIAELTTDKASFDFESPASGTLRKTLARERSILPTGYILALLGDAADALPDVSELNRGLLEQHRSKVRRPTPVVPAPGPASPQLRATPAARRVARENGIDLAKVRLAVSAEVITEEDVRKFIGTKPA